MLMRPVVILGVIVAFVIAVPIGKMAFNVHDQQEIDAIRGAAMLYADGHHNQYPPDGLIMVSDAVTRNREHPDYAAGEQPQPWDVYLRWTPRCSWFGRGHFIFTTENGSYHVTCDVDSTIVAGPPGL